MPLPSKSDQDADERRVKSKIEIEKEWKKSQDEMQNDGLVGINNALAKAISLGQVT